MKKNFTLLKQLFATTFLLFFITAFSFAQVVEVATNMNVPTDMVVDGNDMYVSEFGSGRILKIDLTQTPPFTPVEIATGISSCVSLALKGDDLYISQASGISKIDLTQTPPIAATQVVSNLSNPIELVFNGDNLFFPENGAGKISMIDVTQAQPTVVDVVTGLNAPYGIALIGNELFFAEYGGGKIGKIDITQTFPISNITEVVSSVSSPAGIFRNGNELYISEYSTGIISKIDLTASLPTTTTEVLAGINEPLQYALFESELYLTHANSTISKFEITVSNNDPTPLTLEIFPNPTEGMLTLKGNNIDRIEIIDIYGRVLFSKKQPDSNIDISAFPNGIYFLKMTSGEQEISKQIVKRK